MIFQYTNDSIDDYQITRCNIKNKISQYEKEYKNLIFNKNQFIKYLDDYLKKFYYVFI